MTSFELLGAGTGVFAGVFKGVSDTGEILLEIENWDCSRDIFVDVGRGRTGRICIGVTEGSADETAWAVDSLVALFSDFINANRIKYWNISWFSNTGITTFVTLLSHNVPYLC